MTQAPRSGSGRNRAGRDGSSSDVSGRKGSERNAEPGSGRGSGAQRSGASASRGAAPRGASRGGPSAQRGGAGAQRSGASPQRGGSAGQRGASDAGRGGASTERGGAGASRSGFSSERSGGPSGQRGGTGASRGGPGAARGGSAGQRGAAGAPRGASYRGGPAGSDPAKRPHRDDDGAPDARRFGKAKPATGKAGKSSKPRPTSGKSAGPAPFSRERFGRSLGPVRRPKSPKAAPVDRLDVHNPEGIRLQKVMASAGVASRRVCEDMIRDGRVEVDGTIVTDLGVRVDPNQVAIHVDGITIQLNDTMMYYVFNKPKGVVSTMEDPEGRPCIGDFLRNKSNERLFHVGRLDVATEGLLLLTNDGELTNRLTHPSFEIPKTYLVQVRGPMAHGIGAQMKEGIELEDGIATVDSFKLVDSTPGHILVEVVLHSGRNRIVRRLFDAVGHPVERLVRTQFGPIRVNDQRQGSIRVLGRQEVGHLLATVGM